LVERTAADSNEAVKPPSTTALNRVTLHETEKRRSLSAEFTDEAVSTLGDALGLYLAGRLQSSGLRRQFSQPPYPPVIDAEQMALPEPPGSRQVSAELQKSPEPADGSVDIETLMAKLNSSAHPEVFHSERALDRGLHVLRIARRQGGIDGLSTPQVARILTEKFRISISRQSIQSAFDSAGEVVDRVRSQDGVYLYRLMAAGETYLDSPEAARAQVGGRRRSPRRRASGRKTAVSKTNSTESSAMPSKPARKMGSHPGPKQAVMDLVNDGFLKTPKTVAAIDKHLEQSLGHRYGINALGPTMLRLLREKVLSRTQGSDGQYEYTSS
jgi:hypothetical protein